MSRDLCSQKGPMGYVCTRLPKHDGQHEAHGCMAGPCETWSDDPPNKAELVGYAGVWADPRGKALGSIYDADHIHPSYISYIGEFTVNEKPVLRESSPARGLPTDDKARKEDYPLYSFMFGYFPDSWLAVVQVAVAGNKQHNPGQPLHWAREKSTDQMNTAWRHQFDYGRGVKKDTDGQWHLAKAIWRLSAQLQLDIEEERRQNGDK